jgi:NitT/TauT family transport system ATP-binding protein
VRPHDAAVRDAAASPSLPHPRIEAAGVRKLYASRRGDVLAVERVDLAARPGELVVLVGPSGCGKSTVLHILGGFVPATAGEVRLDGVPVTGPDPSRGIVFQESSLFPWLTVLGNVTFGLARLGVARRARLGRARMLIDLVRLSGFEGHYPKELSGGMQQRAALARALATDPAVLLMDEPFGALDAQTRVELQAELLAIWGRTRKTVVFVTHAIDEALYLADRVYVLSPRPASVRAVLDVDLPRPRDHEELLGLDRYVDLHRRIRDLLGPAEPPAPPPSGASPE